MALNVTAMTTLINDFWTILGALVGGFLTFLTTYWIELAITLVIVGSIIHLIRKHTTSMNGALGSVNMRNK